MMDRFEYVNPEFFWLLLLLPALVVWFIWMRHRQTASLTISSLKGFKTGKNWLAKVRPFLFILRLLALAAIIVALARPRTVDESTRIKTTKGIDIVMAIDVSASMLARDLRPSRLEALKTVAARFINARPNDRIGLVEYAGESYTKTPLTSDKSIVLSSLKSLRYNTVIDPGTAIGMGLATAVNRLKESRAKSKVIILLTDGVNNTGFIDPKIASELAVEFGIKVYTIGLGTNGMAQSPIGIRPDGSFQYGSIQVEIDEALLQEIAETTGGQYFRATSTTKLNEIYNEINKLEKTDIEEFKYTNYEEKFRPLALLALALLGLEFLLRYTLFRSFI
ncbi:MAG: VWA domain-containing protein [Bacteroidia bacterium]|nr:VWA domain-containing protein [Bacteroidia bacterium]NNF31779.1 VWA domain-containing protein [Flavobacteriaceae bacterium]MBT8274569.1 VWA domain-containing protein [Bacteroidia bacterium]NNJ81563.1 VWA domain-containing protein [Flavobacteriaceae bacterium]NNK53968.1 VWA domain-containing protein [Flavobacteriaceae bacterium]